MGSWAAALVAAALATGCNYGAGTFHCMADTQCGAGGACELDGLCSQPSGSCPSGRVYSDLSGAQSGQCVAGGGPGPGPDAAAAIDAPVALDASIDTAVPLIDASACFGSGLVVICLDAAPAAPLAPGTAINTDSSPLCAHVVSGGDYCVLAGTTITIDQALRATGGRPLVVIASDTITTTAAIDVGSHRGANPELGAGADPSACSGGNDPGGSGGGAGGSFTGSGGGGGGPNPGSPASPAGAVTTLRGGCAGQDGQGGGASKGLRGHGGGAVWLIAGTKIDARGGITAGGEGGTGGANMQAGAGGGGAGGMIGFDAPSITVGGLVVANGGGGGEGAGQMNHGNAGADADASGAAAGGKGGSGNGGDGGNGSAGAAAGAGQAGTAGGAQGGGGGGGGGAGLIKLAAGATTTGAQLSPAATP